jgi:coproporphyrinogen dehydrogenase HemZ
VKGKYQMIAILLTDVPFEQDIRELFMAFYPGESYTHTPDENAMIVFSGYPEGDQYRMSVSVSGTEKAAFSSAICGTRSETKNKLKRALYLKLSEITGKTLPWGTLTGIRPARLALDELDRREAADDVKVKFQEDYFMTPAKADLCVRTAMHEKYVLDRFDYRNGWSLYIGIPFCPTTCLYCSFTSYPISKWKKHIDDYLDALCRELTETGRWMKGKMLQTVYMGGGTPTSLEPENLDRILTCIEENFDLGNLMELTVEAGRPDSITAEKLAVLKKHHVTRISINPQTMKQETLDLIGRHHTVEMFIEKFHLARSMGFDNINTDLIVGLPNETLDDLKNTMEGIKKLAPDDVTVHALAIKRAARLNTKKEDYADLKCTGTWDMINLTASYTKAMGLEPYYLYRQKNMAGNFENVGYCRPGKEGLYNILIMEEKQTILACGAGTTSRFVYPGENRIERAENVKDPALYILRLDEMLLRKQKYLAK